MNIENGNQQKSSQLVQDSYGGEHNTDLTERKSIKPGYKSIKNPNKNLESDVNTGDLNKKNKNRDDESTNHPGQYSLINSNISKNKTYKENGVSYKTNKKEFLTRSPKSTKFGLNEYKGNKLSNLSFRIINNGSSRDEFQYNKYNSLNNNSSFYITERYYVPTYIHFDRL